MVALPPMTPPQLKIGNVRLENPVLAAPIAGFTDLVFRALVRELGGCGLIYTEMVSAGGWIDGRIEPRRLVGVTEEPKPLGVQLWDREEAPIEEAARRLVDMDVTVIDLNFGCPKRRIMGKHAAGAQLLRDPATVGRLVAAAVRGAGETPVTAKIRIGPTVARRTAVEVARAAEDNGAEAVTVHGRTADESYGIPCRREQIAEVVDAVTVPVIANGDITGPESALEILRETGAAGVMVARAALQKPWVFSQIAAALRGEAIPATPTLDEQRRLLLSHHARVVDRYGDPHGTVLMRKFACRYLGGTPGARVFREHICKAEDSADFRKIVAERFPSDSESCEAEPARLRA
jgi:tRNA-dihydrouridine synthase B